jgi:hypothetical protein
MADRGKQIARQPATKFAHLRKKLTQKKAQSTAIRKK